MRRTLLLSVGLPILMGFLGTILAQTLALPAVGGAQEARIRAEQVTVVGSTGTDRVRLGTGPGANATALVLSPDGRVRALMGTGGPAAQGGLEPETADFVLFAQDGRFLARLGTRSTPESHAAGVNLVLSDSQGRVRLELRVAEEGTPSIQMLDANGNVTWSAR